MHLPSKGKPVLCVVVSFYNARPANDLYALLRQLQALLASPAAHQWPFSVRVVLSVNAEQGAPPLALTQDMGPVVHLSQPNAGFNMGAWDNAWRQQTGCRHFLFLQDECRVLRPDALLRYWQLLESQPQGVLVGESLQYWQGWHGYQRAWPECFACVENMAKSLGVSLGHAATHLQTLVIGVSAQALAHMDGFILADEKIPAIASELLLSRRAVALGMRLQQSAWRPFEYFGHEQWRLERERSKRLRWWLSQLRWRLMRV